MELKYLIEKRAEKQDKMQEILSLAKKEERAMNPDEIKAFNDCKTEIDEIDSTISAEEELRSMQLDDEPLFRQLYRFFLLDNNRVL